MLNTPDFSSCQNPSCAAYLSPIPSHTVFTELATSIYWLSRNMLEGGGLSKSLTPVQDPDSSHWNGKRCLAVLAHAGRNASRGHWLAFLRHGSVWWRVDSSQAGPIPENPFVTQITPNNPNGFTIDVLFFQ